MTYFLVKWLHILSSTFLFGTGIGSAFYLLCATLQRDPRVIAAVARYVVIADWIFTASTIVIQPLTGIYLAHLMQWPLFGGWLGWSLLLYLIAALCWLPVIWLQMRLRDVARQAASGGEALPAVYWFYFRWWMALGFPALFAFLAIFWLMVSKQSW